METNNSTRPVADCKTATIRDLKYAIYNRFPISGIEVILNHIGPHGEEITTDFILTNTPEGERAFPGIKDAGIGFISKTKLDQKGYSGTEGFYRALQAGYLLVGVGGGPFDEHPNREEHISCTNLIVKHINLLRNARNKAMYGDWIEYTNYEDGHGDNLIKNLNEANPGHVLIGKETKVLRTLEKGMFAQNIKKGFEAAGDDHDKQTQIIMGAYQTLRNEFENSRMFFEAQLEYDTAEKEFIRLDIPEVKEKLMIVRVKSDHPLMNKVVSRKNPNNKTEKWGIAFIHKSNGQFVLIANRQYIKAETMIEVAKILRNKVAFRDNRSRIEFRDIGKDESISQVPELHIFAATGNISNGSRVDPDVTGLIGAQYLSLRDVVEAIQTGLDASYFPKRFASRCKAGDCARNICPLYGAGLERCHAVRKMTKKAVSNLGENLEKALNEKSAVEQ